MAQALQNLQVLGHRQKALHARRDLGANAVYLRNLFLAGQQKLLDRQKALSQQFAHALANVANTQRKQHAAKRLLFGTHQLIHDLLGGLLTNQDMVARAHTLLGIVRGVATPRLEGRDVIYGKVVEIGHVVDESCLE